MFYSTIGIRALKQKQQSDVWPNLFCIAHGHLSSSPVIACQPTPNVSTAFHWKRFSTHACSPSYPIHLSKASGNVSPYPLSCTSQCLETSLQFSIGHLNPKTLKTHTFEIPAGYNTYRHSFLPGYIFVPGWTCWCDLKGRYVGPIVGTSNSTNNFGRWIGPGISKMVIWRAILYTWPRSVKMNDFGFLVIMMNRPNPWPREIIIIFSKQAWSWDVVYITLEPRFSASDENRSWNTTKTGIDLIFKIVSLKWFFP
jgi:hypothetical protein